MVGDAGTLLRRGLGRADVHVPVHLAAVGVDHFPVQLQGQADGQVGLSDGRGAYDG